MSSQTENEKRINDLTIENEKIKKELSTLRKDIFLYAKMKKDRETYNDDTKYEKFCKLSNKIFNHYEIDSSSNFTAKEKFDFKYLHKTVHCESVEDSNKFLNEAHSAGYCFKGGRSIIEAIEFFNDDLNGRPFLYWYVDDLGIIITNEYFAEQLNKEIIDYIKGERK